MPPRRILKDAMKVDAQLSQFVFGQSDFNASNKENEVFQVPLSLIHRTSLQQRRYFDTQQIEEWANTEIKVNGIRSPLWVRPLPDGQKGEFELIAGERRYRAAKFLGLDDVPVRCFNLDDRQALMASLIENMQRQDLSPLEETEGTLEALSLELKKPVHEVTSLLFQMNNAAKGKVNQNVLVSPEAEAVISTFKMLGRLSWKSFVSSRLPLLKKPSDILAALREGKIEYTKANLISRVKDSSARNALLELAIIENLSINEIRQKIRLQEINSKESSENTSFENSVSDVLLRFKKSKAWEDPKRRRQIQKLIDQMEALMKT